MLPSFLFSRCSKSSKICLTNISKICRVELYHKSPQISLRAQLMITYVKKCTIMKTYRLDFLKLVYEWCKLVYRLVYGAKNQSVHVHIFSTVLHLQGCEDPPSGGSAFLLLPPHVLHSAACRTNRFPSSF